MRATPKCIFIHWQLKTLMDTRSEHVSLDVHVETIPEHNLVLPGRWARRLAASGVDKPKEM